MRDYFNVHVIIYLTVHRLFSVVIDTDWHLDTMRVNSDSYLQSQLGTPFEFVLLFHHYLPLHHNPDCYHWEKLALLVQTKLFGFLTLSLIESVLQFAATLC